METKKYTIELTTDKYGEKTLHRINDGFTSYELLGLLELTSRELFEQFKGVIEPDVIKRTVIED